MNSLTYVIFEPPTKQEEQDEQVRDSDVEHTTASVRPTDRSTTNLYICHPIQPTLNPQTKTTTSGEMARLAAFLSEPAPYPYTFNVLKHLNRLPQKDLRWSPHKYRLKNHFKKLNMVSCDF